MLMLVLACRKGRASAVYDRVRGITNHLQLPWLLG